MIGVIYDPVKDILYRAVAGQGAERNGQAWRVPARSADDQQPLHLYCDCTFESHPEGDALVQQVRALAERQGYAGLQLEIGGGGVLNACWVLEHAPACYFKKPKLQSGGGSLWDFAATACLFKEAGGTATDFYGAPLDLNRGDSTFMNHRGVLYASSLELATAVQRII